MEVVSGETIREKGSAAVKKVKDGIASRIYTKETNAFIETHVATLRRLEQSVGSKALKEFYAKNSSGFEQIAKKAGVVLRVCDLMEATLVAGIGGTLLGDSLNRLTVLNSSPELDALIGTDARSTLRKRAAVGGGLIASSVGIDSIEPNVRMMKNVGLPLGERVVRIVDTILLSMERKHVFVGIGKPKSVSS